MTPEEKAELEPEFNRALDLREKDVEESIRIFIDLHRRFPDHGSICGMLGGIYHAKKNWVLALYWSEKAVKLSPKSELASLCLLHSLWEHGRFGEAMNEAKRFIVLNGMTDDYAALMEDLDNDGVFG